MFSYLLRRYSFLFYRGKVLLLSATNIIRYYHKVGQFYHFIIKGIAIGSLSYQLVRNVEDKIVSFAKVVSFAKEKRGVLKSQFFDNSQYGVYAASTKKRIMRQMFHKAC